MSDMPKQQYLSRDDKGWKLRRNVPKPLQKIADKTAWVERLAGMSHEERRKRAATFAVHTNQEIDRLRLALRQLGPTLAVPKVRSGGFDLTNQEIEQLVIHYFHMKERAANDRGYQAGVDAENRADVVLLLGEDNAYAQAVADRDRDGAKATPDEDLNARNHLLALQLLIEHQYLEQADFEEHFKSRRGRPRTVLRVSDQLSYNQQFRKLAQMLAEANAELTGMSFQAVAEDRHPSPNRPLFKRAHDTQSATLPQKARRLGELVDAYLEKKQAARLSASRIQQFSIAARALDEEIGRNVALSSITKVQCDAIAELFSRIPAYATRHYPNMTLRKAAEAFEGKNHKSADRFNEGKKNLQVLKDIFELALDKEWLDRSPAARTAIDVPLRPARYSDEENGYEPFTIDELNIIFRRPLYTGCENDANGVNRVGPNVPRRSRFWVPLIALFAGMRAQEILQLERSDIKIVSGVQVLDVTDKVHGNYAEGTYIKSLKAKNSKRSVPIHPELERLGFFEFVDSTEGEWLFPDVGLGQAAKMSNQFTKRFKTFLEPTGIWVSRRKVFHSFRNTFNDGLRNARVIEEHREAIMGWRNFSKMDARYGAGYAVETLNPEVGKVEYRGLDLSHLYPR